MIFYYIICNIYYVLHIICYVLDILNYMLYITYCLQDILYDIVHYVVACRVVVNMFPSCVSSLSQQSQEALNQSRPSNNRNLRSFTIPTRRIRACQQHNSFVCLEAISKISDAREKPSGSSHHCKMAFTSRSLLVLDCQPVCHKKAGSPNRNKNHVRACVKSNVLAFNSCQVARSAALQAAALSRLLRIEDCNSHL